MQAPQHEQFMAAFATHCDGVFRYCYTKTNNRAKALQHVEQTYRQAFSHLAGGGSVEDLEIFLYNTATTIMMEKEKKWRWLIA